MLPQEKKRIHWDLNQEEKRKRKAEREFQSNRQKSSYSNSNSTGFLGNLFKYIGWGVIIYIIIRVLS